MKKIILMVAVAMMTAMNVNAQNENLHHELSLSYGLGSIAQLGDGIGEGLGLAFTVLSWVPSPWSTSITSTIPVWLSVPRSPILNGIAKFW